MLLGQATSLQLETLSWKFKLCVSVSKYLFIIISYFYGIASIKKPSNQEYEWKLRYALMEGRLLEIRAVRNQPMRLVQAYGLIYIPLRQQWLQMSFGFITFESGNCRVKSVECKSIRDICFQ